MNLHIKRIEITDPEYVAMVALRDRILRQPLGLSIYNDDLSKDEPDIKLIAVNDGQIAGCLMLKKITDDIMKLRAMAVDTTLQKGGIGAALVAAAEAVSRTEGCSEIQLHARVVALKFYEKLGYIPSGDEFTEVGIPHLFMTKQLHEQL